MTRPVVGSAPLAASFLPVSLGGRLIPPSLAYDSTNGVIYVGGDVGDRTIAIDGALSPKIARIPPGPEVGALCGNNQENKVYGANDVSDLAPGIYVVVTPSPSFSPPLAERVGVRGRSAVTKVVIQN